MSTLAATTSSATAPGRPAPEGTLLLVNAVRLRRGPNGLQLDDQTCAGVQRWTENFARVIFMGIGIDMDQEVSTSVTWRDVDALPCRDRVEFVALPYAYKAGAFAKTYRRTRREIGARIAEADYLCYTLGYHIGDWGSVAALESIAQKRPYAAWFDRVEHDVIRNTMSALSWKGRLRETAVLPFMIRYHRYLIRRSAVGLFQGADTYAAYKPYATRAACVYDVHTHGDDFIDAATLEAKIARIESGAPLRIGYVGRVDPMKGPEDWLRAIRGARGAGVDLHATWLGDGPLFGQAKALVGELGLEQAVTLAGYVSDRKRILQTMRESDLFVFCHKTQESPRCLIEALVSGAPLVGYAGAYPQDLISGNGGGALSPQHDVDALARRIVELNADRPRLAALTRAAARDGLRFDEEKLYRDRANLIKSQI